MVVFVVQHGHHFEEEEDVKLIGVYSSLERAEYAVEQMKKLPGFIESPDTFFIDEYELDVSSWETGYVTITLNQE